VTTIAQHKLWLAEGRLAVSEARATALLSRLDSRHWPARPAGTADQHETEPLHSTAQPIGDEEERALRTDRDLASYMLDHLDRFPEARGKTIGALAAQITARRRDHGGRFRSAAPAGGPVAAATMQVDGRQIHIRHYGDAGLTIR
jgi:hypothetical protein